MKTLIIEDDQNKLGQLTEHINKAIPNVEIVERRSYQSGLKEITKEHYDLILLDMSMPTFDISPQERGGRPRAFAGKDILRQMSRYNITTPVIVVTQFEMFGDAGRTITLKALSDELSQEYARNYLGTVYYNAALNNWKSELTALLDLRTKRG